MITRLGLAPRRPGLDAETFQAHWRGRHGDLAGRLPGVRRYWQNHAVLRGGEPLLPWTGFDACAEIDFPDLPTMQAAFETALYQGDIRADEDYLIEKPKGGMILAERVGPARTGPPEGVRLLTFLRRAPGQPASALREVLAARKPVAGAKGREVYLALDPEAAAGHVSVFDAVEIDWFAAAEEAERHVVSAEARERRAEAAHLVRGVERLIAQVRVIVGG